MLALDPGIKTELLKYATAHIADEKWHVDYFSFINDTKLAKRLGDEFISTRVIYKILEGLEAEDWLHRAQIRLQILSYASIYEAAIHHILFERLSERPEVLALTEFPTKKLISIPREHLAVLEKYLEHDGRKIIPTYEAVGRTDESKVRFDRKAECVYQLGFIEDWLKDELIEFYEARNAIHIHAEIRKSLEYQIDLSRRAYMRMQPFQEQISARLSVLGLA
ncbi:MAG: hypothetical protein QOD89_1311 [Bradyrhizobium sp.]|jgi:hypothetical protein|nr:hypothetical protein [Bradyrhizobium sp.]